MLFKKGLFSKRRQMNEEMSLQITSMADIFTIILVFLLKSYATGAVNLAPTKGMLIPEANASAPASEALKVEISEKAVQVEGNPAAVLGAFRFEPSDLQGGGISKSLSTVLDRERKRQILIASHNADVKVDPKIIIVADKRTPYETVKTVLASAAVHGYTDFKLAVIKGD
ncbi:MAG: hypothetical protein A2583_09845 [Bdellovibrionales bacterium RIFOXYD1_FULL_53_11]|nr:MAG: hypothetical protein A2583_09845 [Bdellovibrionales bacterium RIFOXYD1_FULL_53_11]